MTAGVLALAMAVYGIVGTAYIGFNRISFSDLERLPVGKRSATYAFAVLVTAVIMIVHGLGAVLMLRHRPVGRRIVLVMSAFTAVFAAAGSVSTRGVFLVENVVGVMLVILIFVLSWADPTREWVAHGTADRGMVSGTPNATQFRFPVDSVFTIAGRGTTVIGVIEAGTISISSG
ncbi:hypothetical protein OHB26_25215 [Nocardia sp. NBC_01503]|uniref:hypothetical protein n=1 Tax=Nocardia sp. NBC_01503 TaxID=2975997 RepID=UPI002E7B9B14|nr:hypothetical protein [Nocardia sp. NBC_01503]WTL30234.1 hypothetical protein OHB26_25215 [Nocardia sp. NBC_01503]